jgi:catechol 2,3-dioxygenase-like lactoylglutathione lyase family enzyme
MIVLTPARVCEGKPMTQIRQLSQPVKRRPGEVGIHSVDAFNFAVPDLAVADKFYREFGLDVREEGGALALYTFDHPHRWGTISEGSRKKMQFISLGAFEEDMPKFRERLDAMRIERLQPPKGFESNGIWLRDPAGLLVEIRVAEKSSAAEKATVDPFGGVSSRQNAPNRSKVRRVRPRRLSHVLLFSPDVAKSMAWYRDVFGLRVSDYSGDGIAFMHGIHGSDHHILAFAKSEGPGLHHLSWDVPSIDDIGLGAMHMLGKGFDRGWGLGRHVLGSNFFHYVRDPWGSYSEYSCDIDFIPHDFDWDAKDNDAEDSFYVWGPNTPEDFTFNHELAK